jgi:Holliday junction DNA helicase RuvA
VSLAKKIKIMISYIRGKLVEKTPTEVVIECNGVGYEIHISLHTYSQIPESENVKLHTYFQVKEDAHSLFGFAEKKERELFKLLISVSGIGASTARTMLSSLNPEQIIQAIAANDVGTVQSIKGIGLKTAQRVILDIKDKVLKIYAIEEISGGSYNTNKEEALSALEVLGYIRKNAEKVVEKIIVNSPAATVEELIKQALKVL